MERYLFTHDGYRCIDVDGTILYQSEKHEDLFQFVDKDETPLYKLISDYTAACVDIQELMPRCNDKKNSIYSEMSGMLNDLHPFCTSEYLDREIALYFNDKLTDISLKRSTSNSIYETTERQYKIMFDSLFPDGFGLDGYTADENDFQHLFFYTDYRKKLVGDVEYHVQDAPFADLRRAILLTKDYLYWVLDSQAEPFCDMTLPQRLYVYNVYHHPETFKIASTEVEYFLGSSERIRFDGPYTGIRQEIPLIVQLSDGRYMAEVVQGITSTHNYQDINDEAKKHLHGIIREAKSKTKLDEFCAVYGIRDLFTLLFMECQRMYEEKVSIRRCERCGHYFIASKQMYKYCERPIDEDSLQTCRDVGAKESAKKKLSDDPLYYLYNKAYRTHHARIRAGHITKGEFDAWAKEAKLRMNAVLENPLLWDAYAEWLKV